MIRETTRYEPVCDECGQHMDNNDAKLIHAESREQAVAEIVEGSGKVIDGKHYCEGCWEEYVQIDAAAEAADE